MKKQELAVKYNELLYAVERKFPDESRHETALRYIKQAERLACACRKCESEPKRIV